MLRKTHIFTSYFKHFIPSKYAFNKFHQESVYISQDAESAVSRMSSRTIKRPFTVIVEGNIGSGKTTFINYFERYNDVATFAEPVDQWRNVDGHNLLDLLYSDTKKAAMTFQSYVQLTMVDIHKRHCPQPIKVMERSLHSARHCFVENLYQNGYLDGPEYTVLDEWYKWLCKSVNVEVDMIVYLRTSPKTALERIKKRARDEEREVPLSYLVQLDNLHEKWLCTEKSNITAVPVFVIDGNNSLSVMEGDIKRCAQLILGNRNQKNTDIEMYSKVHV